MTTPDNAPADGDVYPDDPLSVREQMSSATSSLRASLARTLVEPGASGESGPLP
jgi:hypothetical protein